MDSATSVYRITDYSHLKADFCALFARVETTRQAIHANLYHTACSYDRIDGTGDDVVKSLTAARINEIVQDVVSKRSTWTELREQYPPEQSCLAPLITTLSASEAVTDTEVTDLDAILMVNSVYRQAAAMAAYGYETLNFSLDGAQVSRRRVKQASDIFAKLCATLTDTHDLHIDLVARKIAEKGNTCRHEQVVSRDLESESVVESKSTAPVEPTIQHLDPI
ncbi:hypothetical protein H4S07_005967, partial [Coemansia furcata]